MKNIDNILINVNYSLREVLSLIDKSSMQIALVVDANKKLLGTVTDGDIRRGLLRALKLEAIDFLMMFVWLNARSSEIARLNIYTNKK